MLEDGTYDVFVVDAVPAQDPRPAQDPSPPQDPDQARDPATAAGSWSLELTIVAGPHKGELVAVSATGLRGSEFDLIGMPGTLVVADGAPSFEIDR